MEKRIRKDVLGDYKKYGYGRWAVVHKQDARFIGFCGLKYLPKENEVDLGYRFIKAYWGMGLASESGKAALDYGFNELGLKRIVASALTDNVASIRVMEKLGMTFEKNFEEDGEKAVKYVIEKAK